MFPIWKMCNYLYMIVTFSELLLFATDTFSYILLIMLYLLIMFFNPYYFALFTDNPNEKSAPEFIKELQDIEVVVGQSVKFRAKVRGYPLPRVLWYRDGKRIKNCDQYRIGKTLECFVYTNFLKSGYYLVDRHSMYWYPLFMCTCYAV